MSYNYVVTAQKPTAVNGCVTGTAGRGMAGTRGLGGRGRAVLWYRGSGGTGTRGVEVPRGSGDPGGGFGAPGRVWEYGEGFGVGRGSGFTGEFRSTRGLGVPGILV